MAQFASKWVYSCSGTLLAYCPCTVILGLPREYRQKWSFWNHPDLQSRNLTNLVKIVRIGDFPGKEIPYPAGPIRGLDNLWVGTMGFIPEAGSIMSHGSSP